MAPDSGVLIQTNEAAATLTVGTDALRNERKRVSSRLRYLTGLAVVGSAAINDSSVDVYIEDYFVGTFLNSRAGVVAPIYPDDVQPIRPAAIPPGSQLAARVTDAPATSPLIMQFFGFEQ